MPGPDQPAAGSPSWPSQAADSIEAVVTGIAEKTVRPLTLVARGLVFGLIAGVMSTAAIVFAAITLVRILDAYAFPTRHWASLTVVGGIFLLFGLLLWSLRSSRAKE